MIQTLQGVINGKTIELVVDPGFRPGQKVEVLLKETPVKTRIWGEGIMRSAGAFAGTEEDDRILAEIEWERKHGPDAPAFGAAGVSFLLDTNICSAHLKRPSSLAHRMMQHSGRLGVSTVTIAELYAWIHRSQDPVRREALLLEFLVDTQVYSFDQDCAEVFGRIRAVLLAQGISVPGLDLQIASTALAHDLTLVTHNVADFQNNPNLRVVDWLES